MTQCAARPGRCRTEGREGIPNLPPYAWIAVVLAIVAIFLFTEKARDTGCIHNVVIYGVAVLPHNCDSPVLARRLLSFDEFYTEYHSWKGRPVYHAYGMVAGNALVPFALPLLAVLLPGTQSKERLWVFALVFNFHLAYFLLNIAVVLACAWIAIRVSGLPPGSPAAIALAAAVASTDIVEGGVWLLHTNIFNLLAAFGAVLFVVLGMQRVLLSRGAVLFGGTAIGLGILIYPALAVLAPAYIAGRLFARYRIDGDGMSLGDDALETCLFLAAVAVFPLIWWACNRYLLDSSTYMTADRGQFVWVLNSFHDGTFLKSVARHFSTFSSQIQRHSGSEAGLAVISIALLMVLNGRKALREEIADPVIWAVLIASLGVLSFNFLQGYYAARMHVAATYVLYVIVARLPRHGPTLRLSTFCLAGITLYQLGDAMMTYTVSGD